MKWLIWKEYRLNRMILIVGAILFVLPYLIFSVLAWYGGEMPVKEGMSRLSMSLTMSSVYSLVLSQWTFCMLGGNAFACERVDRSAEFLVYLPVSRRRTLAGKLVLPLLAFATVWSLNLGILTFNFPEAWQSDPRLVIMARPALAGVALTGLLFFSVGWLLSSLLESPTFSIAGGLITPLAVAAAIAMGANTVGWLTGRPTDEFVGLWYRTTCLGLGPACFVAGTWIYLRRVEP